MGNGSGTDDFLHNADLFYEVLERYYFRGDFHLILNGDVEELQRFSPRTVRARWSNFFDLFSAFAADGRFTRIVGNHDLAAWDPTKNGTDKLIESLRLRCGDGEIFIFHGHQTSRWYENHNHWAQFGLRYLANPLRIKNRTVAHNSRKRFQTEELAYNFASREKILAVIGHTHRPLFESMSKIDSIHFEIERLCRKYPKVKKQDKIEKRIHRLTEELMELTAKERKQNDRGSLYREHLLVPSLFNSGCVIGKRGITALEIERGKIRLVHWYDRHRVDVPDDRKSTSLPGTDYYKQVVKKENLDYVFSRIRLLA